MITRFHAKYYASLLSRHSVGGDIDSLSQSLLSSTVDINPHQIDAALFAFKSPFNKGVVLADEVGLGKTIEAGLVLCQYWSTGKKKIIIVCPASLRKQWEAELHDKFGILSELLDSVAVAEQQHRHVVNPEVDAAVYRVFDVYAPFGLVLQDFRPAQFCLVAVALHEGAPPFFKFLHIHDVCHLL